MRIFTYDLSYEGLKGSKAKTTEIESLRFQDNDLQVLGTLEFGQFGVVRNLDTIKKTRLIHFQIHVVKCLLDNRVYVRKSIEKRFALRNRQVRMVVSPGL